MSVHWAHTLEHVLTRWNREQYKRCENKRKTIVKYSEELSYSFFNWNAMQCNAKVDIASRMNQFYEPIIGKCLGRNRTYLTEAYLSTLLFKANFVVPAISSHHDAKFRLSAEIPNPKVLSFNEQRNQKQTPYNLKSFDPNFRASLRSQVSRGTLCTKCPVFPWVFIEFGYQSLANWLILLFLLCPRYHDCNVTPTDVETMWNWMRSWSTSNKPHSHLDLSFCLSIVLHKPSIVWAVFMIAMALLASI